MLSFPWRPVPTQNTRLVREEGSIILSQHRLDFELSEDSFLEFSLFSLIGQHHRFSNLLDQPKRRHQQLNSTVPLPLSNNVAAIIISVFKARTLARKLSRVFVSLLLLLQSVSLSNHDC